MAGLGWDDVERRLAALADRPVRRLPGDGPAASFGRGVMQDVSAKLMKAKVGKRLPVLIDEAGPTVARGRTKYDAPEIDGTVYVASRRPLRAGDIVTVKIERAEEYDLHGMAV